MPSPFVFITSQVGAEPIIKAEVARQYPESKPAFSRPGLLTFKFPEMDAESLEKIRIRSVFARSWGFSLGTITQGTEEERVAQVWKLAGDRRFDRIHVWGRDLHKIGDYKFEPRRTQQADALCWKLCQEYPGDTLWRYGQEIPAHYGDLVLDCVLIDPIPPEDSARFLAKREENAALLSPERQGNWLIGYHRVHSFSSALPGGMLNLDVPPEVVSRAWLKMEEALRWSRLPMGAGSRVCEIGSAPGGATQALLSRGCEVLGIDPAEMDPVVMEHPNFRHIRTRIARVRRKEFRKIRWLTCDINVPPNYTLDVIESVVMHPEVNVRGMILTLKFPDWNMGFEVQDYLDRIRGWGFNKIKARQLHYSHQEICVACLKKPFHR
ncbi:MAG: SAM-dependent methyltransferase [Planctomycetia bacterium]|nr:SAM-dependent methyltransferase [Planctomycetia bacterium]